MCLQRFPFAAQMFEESKDGLSRESEQIQGNRRIKCNARKSQSAGLFGRTVIQGKLVTRKRKKIKMRKKIRHLHVSLIHLSGFECPATVEMANSGVVKISAVDKGPHNQRQSRR